MMRRLVFALALAGVSWGAVAQDFEIPQTKHGVVTNSFWSNWYVSAGGEFNASYSSQEAHGLSGNPFSSRRGTFGFDAAVGKWFTPGIGLRTKFQGLWAKQVNGEHSHPAYKYWNIHEDVTFNLSNLLFGYNETRLWNFIPYVGIGVGRNTDAHSNSDITYNAGLLNNFRIGNRVSLFLDVFALVAEGSFDGARQDEWAHHEKKAARHWDKMVGAAVGVTFHLGKHTWKKAPDMDALMAMNQEQLEAVNASLHDQQEENARLREMLSKRQPGFAPSEPAVEFVATSQSVFFDLGSSKISSSKDLVNVKEVAEYAKANGCDILVTGYADSRTGNAEANLELSLKRANTVADELVKMGVSRDRIVVEAKGGVDLISPFSYNRRVTVRIR